MQPLVRAIATTAALAMPVRAWAQERAGDGWGMHPMWGTGGGVWGISMMLVMLLFWVLVLAGLVLGVRWLVTDRRPPASDRALALLRERYARGEIDREEFEARRRDLEAA